MLLFVYKTILIMARIVGFLVICPFFSSSLTSQRAKAALALFLAMILFFNTQTTTDFTKLPTIAFIFKILTEFINGLILGFIPKLLVEIFFIAGDFISFQMGLSAATSFDPTLAFPIPMISQFFSIMVVFVWLSINGELALIKYLSRSFKLFPVGEFVKISSSILQTFKIILADAINFSLGITAAIFAVNIILSILNKLVQQIQIFIISYPIKILIGFITLLIATPTIINFFKNTLKKLQLFANLSFSW